MSDSIVIIPTYNEKGNVEKMIHAVMMLPHPFDLLIIDDGSPDGTAAIVESLQSKYPNRLHLIKRNGKLGLGTAYIAGFRWALERNYEYIFEMDCDFSHKPEDLIRLRQTCAEEGFDVAIGSRYVPGGGFVNWPTERIWISRIASWYVNTITWMCIRDTTAGFVCYRRRVINSINLDKIKFVGYAFQIEMKFIAKKLGFRLREIPIIFTERVEGVSKMSRHIIREGIAGVLLIQLQSFYTNYRK